MRNDVERADERLKSSLAYSLGFVHQYELHLSMHLFSDEHTTNKTHPCPCEVVHSLSSIAIRRSTHCPRHQKFKYGDVFNVIIIIVKAKR